MAYLNNIDRELLENNFLDKLNQISALFYDIRRDLEHLLVITHSDADGYASAALIHRMAAREGISCSIRYFNRRGTWDNYLNNILDDFTNFNNLGIIFTDIGAEIKEINRIFRNNDKKAEIFILDHHEMENFNEKKILDNIHVLNPTLFGLDGLKEIAGSTLSYLFCKKISLKNIQNAWIALIGITNDTLMDFKDYRSFNRMVLEEAETEGQIEIKEGLRVFGATHESLNKALAHSIFPFIKEISGNVKNSEETLHKLGIDKNTKVINLTDEYIDLLDRHFSESLKGNYIVLQSNKKGLLQFPFEHGLLISISAYKFQNEAHKLIFSSSAPTTLKNEYNNYISRLTKNLGNFVKTPKEYFSHSIFVDAKKSIPSHFWSDVASYSSVNSLYNSKKILFLGGLDQNNIKLSVRCTEEFPSLKEGKGVDNLIMKLKDAFGGVGGGHKLAGGYKIAPNRFKKMKASIDDFFPL